MAPIAEQLQTLEGCHAGQRRRQGAAGGWREAGDVQCQPQQAGQAAQRHREVRPQRLQAYVAELMNASMMTVQAGRAGSQR